MRVLNVVQLPFNLLQPFFRRMVTSNVLFLSNAYFTRQCEKSRRERVKTTLIQRRYYVVTTFFLLGYNVESTSCARWFLSSTTLKTYFTISFEHFLLKCVGVVCITKRVVQCNDSVIAAHFFVFRLSLKLYLSQNKLAGRLKEEQM